MGRKNHRMLSVSFSGDAPRAGWKGMFASAVQLLSSSRMSYILREDSTP
jgi:hypothetical protein